MQIPGYRVIRKINQGGMSTVYLAIQISVGRVVALKVMSPTLNGDPTFSERFQREANIVGQLSHPHIVAIYDIGNHDNVNYIAMDYLAGGSVHDRMMQGISSAEALRITREMATALDHAHEKGYIHRDIKPENILFRADGSAVLTDFGVAKGVGGVSRMTNVGQVVGTPHYMSPEQTRGKPVDARSDLYSLGVVFYEMLTGSVPFQGDEAVAIAIKHISAPVPRLPRQYQSYQKILDKLLAKDPDHRFQRGRELMAAIEALELYQSGVYPKQTDPAELSTLALLQALFAAATNAINSRLRRLAQLRWTPQEGLHRHTAQFAEPVFDGDDERSTVIATRIQQATNLQALTSPRKRLNKPLAVGIAATAIIGIGMIFSLLPTHAPMDGDPISKVTPIGTANASVSTHTPVAPGAGTSPEAVSGEGETLPASPASQPNLIYPLFAMVPDINGGNQNGMPSANSETAATNNPAEPPPSTFALTVLPTPADALVRIMNIVPRYHAGIALAPGRYHIEVSHPGFRTYTDWVTITDEPLTTEVTLKEAPPVPRNFSSPLPGGKSGPAMVTIDPGTFTMGDEADSAATPVHAVRIVNAFAISQYEITFDDYDFFAKATERALPGDNRWGRGNRPVVNVTWEDAAAYTQWLSKLTGKTYRLPSESEWEYVARAGTTTPYWWGEDITEAAGKANCRRGCNSRYSGLFGSKTAPVGSYPPNDFGVYDTAGNVAEWVLDCHFDNYSLKPKNGRAFEVSACPVQVVRGGSARSNLDQIASHQRDSRPAGTYEEHIGFRVVMELD